MTTVGTTIGGTGAGNHGGLPATTFFSRTYDEARDLLVESRDYMAATRGIRFALPTRELIHSMETLRLTTRLTQIMAWLILQRALHAGEITMNDLLAPASRLGPQDICETAGGEATAELPAILRELLTRSRKLYQRIHRLDEMIVRDNG
jgi:regulator of CtrA degradation